MAIVAASAECQLSVHVDTSTPTGNMVLVVLSAVAQLERSLIAKRVRAGIKNAKGKSRSWKAGLRYSLKPASAGPV